MAKDKQLHHFVSWARNHALSIDPRANADDLQDLRQIRDMVGNARIVGLGESQHYVAEFNRFRSRLFKYLVAEMGFTTFVFECDVVEGNSAYEYVLGLHDRSDDAFLSLGSIFGLWHEIQELLQWMREYNEGCPDRRKLRFYGMDGSQSWSCTENSVAFACDYLSRVDPKHAEMVRDELLPLAASVKLENLTSTSSEDVRELVCGLTALVAKFQVEQIHYIQSSTWEQFDWAHRSAVIARQIGTMLSAVHNAPDQAQRIWWNIRDACMATNLKWIIDREGPNARLLVGAHNIHLQNAFGGETDFEQTSMGQLLSSSLPQGEMLMIAGTNYFSLKPEDPAVEGSFQWALAQLDLPSFVLDLRPALEEQPVAEWLGEVRADRTNTMYQPIAVSQAWDAVFYTQRVTLDGLSLPAPLRRSIMLLDQNRLHGLVGTYDVDGVVGQPVVLHVYEREGSLISNGAESDGELFPMHEARLSALSDSRFCWSDWPMELEFERDLHGIAQGLRICSPDGHSMYYGIRRP